MDPLDLARPPSDASDPWLGRLLADKYQIQELIAAGGMGRVYKAVQEPLGRSVAVKILAPRTADPKLKAEFKQRFFREAATCARLQHPNTVTLFDYGEVDKDTVYMVMELVQGRTLKALLREVHHLDPVRALRIGHEIAMSLREAHRIGVVHRDLKPANVMVHTDRDGRDAVKVLDFGLVKLLDPETSNANVSSDVRLVVGVEELSAVRKGVVVGSPGYMSPEQIEEKPVDRRSDVYTLGVILFECLTGEPPFHGVNAIETLMLHVTQPAPRVSDRNPRAVIPDEVERIVATCLQKDPARRYQRVDDLLTAIRTAMPPDLSAFDPALVRSRPTLDGRWIGAIVGLALAAAILAALLLPGRA